MRATLFHAAAVLACAGNVAAKKFYLSDDMNPNNFFEKFDFFESVQGTGDYNDVDPTSGHVNYLDRSMAEKLGLAVNNGESIRLSVDSTSILKGEGHPGRNSVRVESKKNYRHGLFIARFSQLPEAECGVWPAFWTVGGMWPDDGEIDIYEQWNDATLSGPVLHTGSSKKYGECVLDGEDQTALISTDVCDNTYVNEPFQYINQGCVTTDELAPWADPTGGVYAMEWTSDYIKIFSWTWDLVPADIDSDTPDPDTWGTPSVHLKNKHCDIDDHFTEQTIILNLNFCGNPAGQKSEWGKSCKAKTRYDTCVEYVSKEPDAFKDVAFEIIDIRHFTSDMPTTPPTSSVSSTSTSTSKSTSVSVATTVPSVTRTAPSNSTFTSGHGGTTAKPTSTEKLIASTIYTTSVHTVTECPPYVEDCPEGGYVTTEIIPLTTTWCPKPPAPTGSHITVTNIYTITSCPPEVGDDCPIGSTATEIVTSMQCDNCAPGSPTDVPSAGFPEPICTTCSVTSNPPAPTNPTEAPPADLPESVCTTCSVTSVPPAPTSPSHNDTAVSMPHPTGCVGDNCPAPVAAASTLGTSIAAAFVGVVGAVMVL